MKDGVKKRTTGSIMHGDALKKKYRSHAPDAKGQATKGKK